MLTSPVVFLSSSGQLGIVVTRAVEETNSIQSFCVDVDFDFGIVIDINIDIDKRLQLANLASMLMARW